MLRDVGHGDKCTCEVCWVGRMRATFGEIEVLTTPKRNVAEAMQASVDAEIERGGGPPPKTPIAREAESRYERLRKLFPVGS